MYCALQRNYQDYCHLIAGIMQKLVKRNQSSFIVARNISDNIIIAQEAIHTMKHVKGNKGWLAIKVDL